MVAGEPDLDALRQLFTELEFTSLLKELLPAMEVGEVQYTHATSPTDIDAVLKLIPKDGALAIAIEMAEPAGDEEEDEEPEESVLPLTVAAQPTRTGGGHNLAISAAPSTAVTVPLDLKPVAERLGSVLADHTIPKTIHDGKRALHTLATLGIEIAGLHHEPMLYSYLLDPTYSSHSLAEIALRRFNLKLAGGLSESADISGRFAQVLREQVEQAGLLQLYHDIDLPLLSVLARMEHAGVKIDTPALAKMSSRLETEIEAKARDIYAACDSFEFNINSPKQLGDVLFNRLALPKPVKYGKGKMISTAVDVLENLALTHEVPRLVLEYRQLSKLKSTYVDALPLLLDSKSGRVHTTFGQTGTATGRLSSTNPNLQNIPIRTELGREIRAGFIAEPGHVLLAADYSQIELRLLAHYSKDPLLVEAYRRGDDVHTLTASQVFGVPPLMVTPDHRRMAKVVNFGIVYGLSPFGLAQRLDIEKSDAKRFIDAYFEKYAGVRRFIDKTLDEARRDGRVKTLFGRVRPIPDINSKNANARGFAERTAVNTPLQGTAADLIKIAMIRIDALLRERKMKSRMTLQVHDELVFEVPAAEVDAMRTLVREQMENVHPPLSVPLQVDLGIGRNWRDLE